MKAGGALCQGLVVAGYGRHFLVEDAAGRRVICRPRGKKSEAVVGDQVLWCPSADEGTLECIEPRRNLFYRRDEIRTKAFAANLDQVLVLLGADPEYADEQLGRALVAAEAAQIAPLIALNKRDLAVPFARAWARLAPYRAMGYTVLPLSLRCDAAEDHALLSTHLDGRTTLVLGPSGAGKSTLINLLAPHARAETGEVSRALNSGRHTTTRTSLYWIDAARRGALIDSPGFQEFGLHHIEPMQLARLMPDLRVQAGDCRFHNCTHLHEPGCGVRSALQAGAVKTAIDPLRYSFYSKLFAELSQPKY